MSTVSASSGVIETLVRTCRARIASHNLRREGFLAVGTTLSGICALLLMGTRYVPIAVLPLVAAFGVWLAVRRWTMEMPDEYAVAQLIDRQERLCDEVATAFHFRSVGGADASEVADAQYGRAARAAEGITPDALFPGTAPTTQRNAAFLLATAVLLVGLRAGLQSTLSFEPPLASLVLSSLFGFEPEHRAAVRAAVAKIDHAPLDSAVEEAGLLTDRPDAESESSDGPLPEESYEPPEMPNEMPEVEGLITLPMEELSAEAQGEDASLLDGGTEHGTGADKGTGDTPTDAGDDSWSDEAESLLDKLKQAFDNMLQTLDMASTETAESDQGQEQGSGNTEEASSQGDPADAGETAEQMSSELTDASMEGGQPGDEAGESASAGNTSGEDSSGEDSSGENASAAGTSDGSKELAVTEQSDVLGTLEELYMERAENIKGEVTIETHLAEQSASVPYNERSTVHADQGGAISRDEIPVQYRTYIQNYFEALRRNTE